MENIKILFGILLLAVSILLLSRIISENIILICWGTLSIIAAIYLGVFQSNGTSRKKLQQAVGILIFIYAILLIVGGILGNHDPFHPLQNLIGKQQFSQQIEIKTVKSIQDVENAIKMNAGKPILLDFYADWCISCKEIENSVLSDPEVQQTLKQFVYLKADVTKNNDHAIALMSHYHVVAPPTFIFLDAKGNELNNYRLVGEFDKKTFLAKSGSFINRLNSHGL